MNEYPSQSQDKFIVRLPDGMREKIKAAADEAGRSMNAEIVHRLESSFRADSSGMPNSMTEWIERFEQSMRNQFMELRRELKAERLTRAEAKFSRSRERHREEELDNLTPSGPDMAP